MSENAAFVRIENETLRLDAIEYIYVDTSPVPDQVVICLKSGREVRKAVNSTFVSKLTQFSRNNPMFVDLTDAG